MTIVTTTTSSGPYTAVAQTTFAVTFYAASATEIEITLAGVIQSPSLYAFTRDADGTGSVVFLSAVTGSVIIYSKPTFDQQTAFSRFGAFFPDQINGPLDKAAARDLYLKNLLVPATNAPADRVSKYLATDASGNPAWVAGSSSAATAGQFVSITQSGSGTALRTDAQKWGEFFTATDLSGVLANGVDQSANLIAGINTNVGVAEGKTIIIPPGVVWHPQSVIPGVITKERLTIFDLGGLNGARKATEHTKIIGVFGIDPDNTEDTYLASTSPHHPVLLINNLGTANSTSAEWGLASLLFARGYWSEGPEDDRNFRGSFIQQYRRSVIDPTIFEFTMRSLAPWSALADAVRYERWVASTAVSVGDHLQTDDARIYKYTVAGTTGATKPTHTSSTAADGTATAQYADVADRILFGLDQHGRVKTNGAGNSADLAAFKQSTTDTTATAVLRISGTGLSRQVRLIAEPTDGAGATIVGPYFSWIGSVMEIRTGGGTLAAQVEANGDLLMYGGLTGYGVGAGGTIAQITSRTTGVTLNKQSGAITLVSAAGTAAWQTFRVNCSKVNGTSHITFNQKSGTDKYMAHVTAIAAGYFEVTYATTGGVTVEQPVFRFGVHAGSDT